MDASPRRRKGTLRDGGFYGVKERSSFAHFFNIKEGIPSELSVEFDLIRYESGRISELEVGLQIKKGLRGMEECEQVSARP